MGYCTGCGKPLNEAAKFCTNCGIRVPEAPVAVAPVPESVASAAPATAVAAAPAPEPAAVTALPQEGQSHGSSAFVVIICAILIILIGAGIAATIYLHNQRKPKEEAQQAASQTVSTDDSFIRALNLQNYPGATPVAIAVLNGDTVIAGFVTKDRPDQVMQFYKVRFPVSDVTVDTAGSHLAANLANGQRIRIDAEPQGASTQVKIVRPN